MIIKGKITAVGKSDVGSVRDNNEDSFTINEKADLLILADGMGGHDKGEIASAKIVEDMPQFILGLEKTANGLPIIRDMITSVHNDIYEINGGRFHGMGSTVVGVWFNREPYNPMMFNVGDSRVYQFTDGKLNQLTTDQVVPGASHMLVEAMGHVVTSPEIKFLSVKPGDVLLLCSDGLTDMVSDENIKKVLTGTNSTNLEEKCDIMIEEAKNGGGKDNITVILAYVN